MNRIMFAAGLAATTVLTSGIAAGPAAAQALPTRPGTEAPAPTITISCYRGPWQSVIWDKPNAVFLDNLTRLGYSQEKARAIGMRVCRDEFGVGDPAVMEATLRKIMAQQAPSN